MRRKVIITAVLALLAIVVGVRIRAVNEDALAFPVETYSIHQGVALDGAFAEYAYENTQGYTVTVTKARRMSVNEYLALYGEDKEAESSYREADGDDADFDSKSLVVLDVEIQNDKAETDERGYLDSIGWTLASTEKPAIWPRTDSALFHCSIPQAEGAYQLSIKPGTTYTTHVPFSYSTLREFPAADGLYYSPEMEPGKYSLILTKAPVRKIVQLDVE